MTEVPTPLPPRIPTGTVDDPLPAGTARPAPKVVNAAAVTAATTLVLLLLNTYVPAIGEWDQEALKLLLGAAVTGLASFAAGYVSRHQWRKPETPA